jgi:hypothetical protein
LCKYTSIPNIFSCIANKDKPDHLESPEVEGARTLWDLFQRTVKKYPNMKFTGTRNNDKPGRPYEWKTYREIYDSMDLFARGKTIIKSLLYHV